MRAQSVLLRERLQSSTVSQKLLTERTALVNNDPKLLRGVCFSTLTSGLGHLHRPNNTISQPSAMDLPEDTFQYSREVTELDSFLSHSWRDSSTLKWITLLWINNFWTAIVGANVVAVLSTIATMLCPNFKSLREIPGFVEGNGVSMGWAFVLWGVSFLLLLLLGSHLWCTDKLLLLDKVCIHQTDSGLKSAGIRSLGAFLKSSKELLVLWGEDYFERLWCCYELATYMLIHGTKTVRIIPVELALLGVSIPLCQLMIYLSFYVGVMLDWFSQGTMLTAITFLPFALVGFSKGGSYRARQHLKIVLCGFDVRESKCYCCQIGHMLSDGSKNPCDREFVGGSIRQWYGDDGGFNKIAREDLLTTTSLLLGPETIMPADMLLVLVNSQIWSDLDWILLSWRDIDFCYRGPSVIANVAAVMLCDYLTGELIALWFAMFGDVCLQTLRSLTFLVLAMILEGTAVFCFDGCRVSHVLVWTMPISIMAFTICLRQRTFRIHESKLKDANSTSDFQDVGFHQTSEAMFRRLVLEGNPDDVNL